MTENTISEFDLFTYYLQKNYWPKIEWDEFVKICKSKGIEIKENKHDTGKDSTKCCD